MLHINNDVINREVLSPQNFSCLSKILTSPVTNTCCHPKAIKASASEFIESLKELFLLNNYVCNTQKYLTLLD